jgi:tetratricopeptide (TPR) repeat protein
MHIQVILAPHRIGCLVFIIAVACLPATAADQSWTHVSSDHFIVLTDAGERKGHDVAARFEQMRAIFGQLLARRKVRMAQPLEIIAIGNDKNFAQLAPQVNGQPTGAPAFFLPGEDRIYVVLNVFQPDSWRAIEHPFAHYLLNSNYPPTQPWFDEGFAEYFASLSLTAKQAELGSDPELKPLYETDLLGTETQTGSLKSFTEILSNPVWLSWPDLFTMKNRIVNGKEGTHHTLFYAQSWILLHYLLNKDKLSEAGAYFDLVENQRVPVVQAIQQAFGMSVAQLDQAVKDYFHSLKPLFDSLQDSKPANPVFAPTAVYQSPLPFSVDDVATSAKSVPLAEAQALVDEMALRIAERREQAFQHLQTLIADPKMETATAHRALAWAYVQKSNFPQAYEELNSAVELKNSDPWTRFGLAQAAYHSGEKAAKVQGLANMMESLHIVIDEYPDFAEAYNLLGWARLTGGGGNAAVEAMRMAVQLNPRNEDYQMRLARAYLAARKFDDANATLERLKMSQTPEIARAAKKDLNDLPFLKKYGVSPEESSPGKSAAEAAPNKTTRKEETEDAEESSSTPNAAKTDETKQSEAKPEIDKRPVKFLKTTIVSVDCSQAPAAVLAVTQGSKTLKLRTRDYKSAVVIGAPGFSCAWKNLPVNVNFRPRGVLEGDLVSIEVH